MDPLDQRRRRHAGPMGPVIPGLVRRCDGLSQVRPSGHRNGRSSRAIPVPTMLRPRLVNPPGRRLVGFGSTRCTANRMSSFAPVRTSTAEPLVARVSAMALATRGSSTEGWSLSVNRSASPRHRLMPQVASATVSVSRDPPFGFRRGWFSTDPMMGGRAGRALEGRWRAPPTRLACWWRMPAG